MSLSERTFLKVFVEVSDNPYDEKSISDLVNDKNSLSNSSPINEMQRAQSTQSQYCTITISPHSSTTEVCQQVARKRNLIYTPNDYELVMCDGDGQASYETILGAKDQPHQFQQSAAKHGHLGDFHFVFRRAQIDSATDIDDESDGDSEPDIFGNTPQQIKNGKYPAAWMEKRGKTHRAWRRRYFVLIGNELLYYKRRDVYEQNKDPIARIELVSPPGIIKILAPETIRKNGGKGHAQTMFLFDIHTPKRVYSLRIDNYNDMIFWVKALSRRNEPNELIDGLHNLVSESEILHSNDDEDIMDKFSDLQTILDDKDATDSYMKYLQSIHNEEFIHFWLDLKQFLNNYALSTRDLQKRFATELYEKYIKSNAKYQLSEIKSKQRLAVKKQIENGLIVLDMFDDIKQSVFDYLNRDAFKFFNSSEYFRFIVTYKRNDDEYEEKYSWPCKFEEEIEVKNEKRNKYILSSNKNIIHNHANRSKKTLSMINTYNAHSPVLRTATSKQRSQSPVVHKRNKQNGGRSLSPRSHLGSKSWNDDDGGKLLDFKKLTKRKKRKSYNNKSIFTDAPGISTSVK